MALEEHGKSCGVQEGTSPHPRVARRREKGDGSAIEMRKSRAWHKLPGSEWEGMRADTDLRLEQLQQNAAACMTAERRAGHAEDAGFRSTSHVTGTAAGGGHRRPREVGKTRTPTFVPQEEL